MAERKKYSLTLNGIRYPITTEESEEYMRKIEFYLNSRINEAKDKTGMHYSDTVTLALLSIDLADTLFKTQAQFNKLTQDTDRLLEKYDELGKIHEGSLEKIEALEAQIDELKEKLLISKLGQNN